MTRRSGFTVVELLVVIAILALLAALLFPVMSNARRQSYKTGCISNLRQLDLAQRQYALDHDGYVSPHQPGGGPKEVLYFNSSLWQESMQPYVRSKSIHYCPADPAPGQPHVHGTYVYDGKRYSSYGAPLSSMWTFSKHHPPRLNIDTIHRPSEAYQFWESRYPFHEAHTNTTDSRTFHYETMSFLYWDGHVVHKRDPWRETRARRRDNLGVDRRRK